MRCIACVRWSKETKTSDNTRAFVTRSPFEISKNVEVQRELRTCGRWPRNCFLLRARTKQDIYDTQLLPRRGRGNAKENYQGFSSEASETAQHPSIAASWTHATLRVHVMRAGLVIYVCSEDLLLKKFKMENGSVRLVESSKMKGAEMLVAREN